MTKYWTTKSGEKVLISLMTNSHLLNTIRYIERTYTQYCIHNSLMCDSAYPDGEPDGAAMCAESEARDWDEEAENHEYIENEYPAYPALVKEANKRHLLAPDLVAMQATD